MNTRFHFLNPMKRMVNLTYSATLSAVDLVVDHFDPGHLFRCQCQQDQGIACAVFSDEFAKS